MTENVKSPHHQVFLLLCRVVQEPACMTKLEMRELDLAIRVLRRERLLGVIALRLRDQGLFESLPDLVGDQFESAIVMAESRARLAMWELDRIAGALSSSQASFTCAAMKGCAYLLLGLPHARGRIFADVDLFLPESEIQLVEETLNRQGWKTTRLTAYDDNYYRKWTHELPPLVHAEREVEIDLHHNILPRTSRLNPDAQKLVEAVQQLPQSPFFVLCNEDLVIHAMTHLTFNEDFADKLRELVDIDVLLRAFSTGDSGFWERLIERSKELGVQRATFYGLRYSKNFLKSPIPSNVMQAMRSWGPPVLILWIMDVLVQRSLFPPHPDFRGWHIWFCRLLLFIRSHWIRMPPWLLMRHLTYKFYARHLRKAG